MQAQRQRLSIKVWVVLQKTGAVRVVVPQYSNYIQVEIIWESKNYCDNVHLSLRREQVPVGLCG